MAYLGSVIASQVMEWFGLMFCLFFLLIMEFMAMKALLS